MRIGIYGGTFNPPHLGHMMAAVTAVWALKLDKLLLIPAGIPPHKTLTEDAASAEHRLAMTRLAGEQIALESGAAVEVLDMEIVRSGRSYTVDTLEELKAQYPDDQFYLLMGTDMFLSFQNWREPERILRYAGLCAFGRSEKDTKELFAPQEQFLREKFPESSVTTLVLPNLVEISSTELRAMLTHGGAEKYLSPQVLGYILREGLYGTNCDLKRLNCKELRAVSLSYLKAKRVAHVLGTEETAVKLAEKYGADVEKARVAALLHDCTKRLSMGEQLVLCEKYGIELDELEQRALKLLHAKTGAAIARDVFAVDEEVYSAILWHTTGRADMTKLEKIIYLADYIEPNRDFPGLAELREAVWEDLDKGLLIGLSMTVEEMKEMGNPIHKNTLEAKTFLERKA